MSSFNDKSFKTGTVIKATVNKFPLISHYGVVLKSGNGSVEIIHNTPNEKNKYGGNIQIDSIDKFLKSRTIDQVFQTKITREKIVKVMGENISRPFHLLSWNCEHFVFKVWKNVSYSPQIINWVKYYVGGSFALLSISRNKKFNLIYKIVGVILIIYVFKEMLKPYPAAKQLNEESNTLVEALK